MTFSARHGPRLGGCRPGRAGRATRAPSLAVTGTRLLPMVKANGYGLGAVAVARALEAVDPWGFGVAPVEEGAALRAAGITRPILVFDAARCRSGSTQYLRARPPARRSAISTALERWMARGDRPFHVEIDTGMAARGFRWDDGRALIGEVGSSWPAAHGMGRGLHPLSFRRVRCWTSAATQWDRLPGRRSTPCRGARPLVHAANSAAALQGGRYAGDLVRPGIFLYGGAAGASVARAGGARSGRGWSRSARSAPGDTVSYGATWRAPRPTTVATLARRLRRRRFRARRGGSRAGARWIELNGAARAGRRAGDHGHDAWWRWTTRSPSGMWPRSSAGASRSTQQAGRGGTISYELLTGLGPRVARRYRRDG